MVLLFKLNVWWAFCKILNNIEELNVEFIVDFLLQPNITLPFSKNK